MIITLFHTPYCISNFDYKGAVLLLGAVGIVGMQAAVFADVGVMVVAVLNSVRTLKVK